MPRRRSQDVLGEALALIAEGGVDAVRYRDVAEAAGVPLGTVSYRYPSREALIRAAFERFLEDNARTLERLRGERGPETLEDLARYLTAIVRADLEDPSRRQLAEYELILYAARDPEIARRLDEWERRANAELAGALEALGIAAPLATARTLMDLVRGFQLLHLGRDAARCARELEDFSRRLEALLGAMQGERHERTTAR